MIKNVLRTSEYAGILVTMKGNRERQRKNLQKKTGVMNSRMESSEQKEVWELK